MSKSIAVIMPYMNHPQWNKTLDQCLGADCIGEVIALNDGSIPLDHEKIRFIESKALYSGNTIRNFLQGVHNDFILYLFPPALLSFGQRLFERLLQMAAATGAGILYGDYLDETGGSLIPHPVLEYHEGSVRDGFNFGPFLFIAMPILRKALDTYGVIPDVHYAGLYDLRLKLSITAPVQHIPEPLCVNHAMTSASSHEKGHFDYVDPKNRQVQLEYETVFTQHLRRINAYLEPHFPPIPESMEHYPVEVSVVIPVLNRERTIHEAVASVLNQKCAVPFNVIVVDNHSTDRTTGVLESLAKKDDRVRHIIPSRTDLGIGGCWNEAIYSPLCGRFAVQLDSDDLYADSYVLQKIYDTLITNEYAMVIGSYTTMDFNLKTVPPGLIDHREWTPDNGRNNALRINGLGAPRAFCTHIARCIGFPNVSYGEDYAMVLALSRRYKIGRIYESLYNCRRWEGNTDSGLPIDKINKNDRYKDHLRAVEIAARRKKIMNHEL